MLALAVDANGVAIPNMKFRWEVLEPLAGSISQDGRLTAGEAIGTFPKAVKVTLTPQAGERIRMMSTSLDVRVVDPATVAQQISAAVLPRVISLSPNPPMDRDGQHEDSGGG